MPKRSKNQPPDEEALKRRFGTVVRSLRQRLDVSQEELAWRADLHRTYLADVERGERNISLASIVKLVRALGVTPGEFFRAFDEHLPSAGQEEAPMVAASSPRAKVARKNAPEARALRS